MIERPTSPTSIAWLPRDAPPGSILAALEEGLGAGVRGYFREERCRAWAEGALAAKDDWVGSWGGEQFALGRAFYTHLEEGKSKEYFASARASDMAVERAAPGLQEAMREVVAFAVGGHVRRRRGFCGPGVHIFPPGRPVQEGGGVIHYDTEGLTAYQIERRAKAISVVAMLAPPREGGGITLWDVLYYGEDHPTRGELGKRREEVRYERGDVLVFDSYRLHQIMPFEGDLPRVSATVHAVEIDRGVWESWF